LFSFREDWHQDDRVLPLVRQYQLALDAVLRDRPGWRNYGVSCRHCGIRFFTHPRNAGRQDLRCPFGCRQYHRRKCANGRSRRRYQKPDGRRNKKLLNGKRSQAGKHVENASPQDGETLSRSKAWVSMRRGLLTEMSQAVQEILFRGAFPVYSYMVTLRPFMRINGVGQQEMERFVQAVAGQRLSVREIELLAHGYFRGPASLRQAIDQGNWKWSLEQMQTVPEDPAGCNDFERGLLRELERLLKSMQCVLIRCDDPRLQTRAFYAQANLLVASLLSRRESFFKKMEEFHDRSGHA